MKYFIIDSTIKKDPIYYNNIKDVITHLEGSVKRKFKVNRKDYMQNLTDLGHGYDESTGKLFVDSLYKHFGIGIVKDNRHVKCNIHDVDKYSKFKTEMGD